jgi:phosphatidylglycerol lysyltransferase
MMGKTLRKLTPLISIVLFSAALWVLNKEMHSIRFSELAAEIRALPARSILRAVALVVLNYLLISSFDTLAFRYIRNPMPRGRTTLAGFISYAFGNNVGNTLITGGSVRYRLYSAWGVPALDIAKVVAFCGMTFWVGFAAVAGVVFLLTPISIPGSAHLPFRSLRPIGAVLLAIAAAYLLLSFFLKKSFKIRDKEIAFPPGCLATLQILAGSLDLLTISGVLYSLLPLSGNLSYPEFLSYYLVSLTAGICSLVPGGIGIFETFMVFFLSDHATKSAVLGSLVVYRILYYALPLCLAAALLAWLEMRARAPAVRKVAGTVLNWGSILSPHFVALVTFLGGALLLFAGVLPTAHSRLRWLHAILPDSIPEVSHFLASLVGMGLLLLARGLQRRIDAAFQLAVMLLGAGILLCLLKGLAFEQALFLLLLLLILLPCRREFRRKAALLSQRFTPGWILLIVIVLGTSLWLGFFSHKHVEYTTDLWWRFAWKEDAPRFLRAMVGATSLALFVAAARLMRPRPRRKPTPDAADLKRAEALAAAAADTAANLALLGDKALFFTDSGNGFVMYAVAGRSWVVMGDPIAPIDEWPDLLWGFRELADTYGGRTVFYQVGKDHVHHYLDLGLTLHKIGEEGRIPLETFSLEGGERKPLRYVVNKLEKDNCVFSIVPPSQVPGLLPEMKTVSDLWLKSKNTREKRFSLGFFDEEYLKRFPAAIVQREGTLLAFANLWLGARKQELSLDLMRLSPDAPNGVMDYLFTRILLWGKGEGYACFNLGMAPLSGLEDHSLAPVWDKIGGLIFRHGEHFYNFRGLREYKDKFGPVWEPKYLAFPGGLALPGILLDIASLVSGGLRGAVAK